jgi:hypothetical protein
VTCQHATYVVAKQIQAGEVPPPNEAKTLRGDELRFQLCDRPSRVGDVPQIVTQVATFVSLSDVGGDGDRCSTDLRGQAEALISRE